MSVVSSVRWRSGAWWGCTEANPCAHTTALSQSAELDGVKSNSLALMVSRVRGCSIFRGARQQGWIQRAALHQRSCVVALARDGCEERSHEQQPC
jgi:hypothetical protein